MGIPGAVAFCFVLVYRYRAVHLSGVDKVTVLLLLTHLIDYLITEPRKLISETCKLIESRQWCRDALAYFVAGYNRAFCIAVSFAKRLMPGQSRLPHCTSTALAKKYNPVLQTNIYVDVGHAGIEKRR